jgi:hypothetical protein
LQRIRTILTLQILECCAELEYMLEEETKTIKIDEKKLYAEIFFNFENEIRELTQYVSVIPQNDNTSSNKIHELHIRICTEVENLIKIVSHLHIQEESIYKKEIKLHPPHSQLRH